MGGWGGGALQPYVRGHGVRVFHLAHRPGRRQQMAPRRDDQRLQRPVQALATLCLGALIVQGGVLGALLTFAGRSVYAVYTGGGGLTALEDQQFAGVLNTETVERFMQDSIDHLVSGATTTRQWASLAIMARTGPSRATHTGVRARPCT